MTLADTILYIGPPVLQGVIAALMFARGLYRVFPIFLAYTVLAVFGAVVRMVVKNRPWLYFEVYWATEALYAVLGLFVLHEAFRQVLKKYLQIAVFRFAFPAIGAATVLLATYRASTTPMAQDHPIIASIVSLEIGVRLVQGAFFCVLFGLVFFLRLPWRHCAFGIALGYGVYAGVTLATGLLRSAIGTKLNNLFVTAPAVAYLLAVMVWLCFFATSKESPSIRLDQSLDVQELKRYKRLVRDFLRR